MVRVVFLHTADVHVATFRRLLDEMAPETEQNHAVQADWLAEARESGLTAALRERVQAFLSEQAAEADAVLCSCSTLGPLADELSSAHANVLRIDRPLMQRAAGHDGTILVALCLESTLSPTLELLREAFAERGKSLDYKVVLCKEQWALFEAGDMEVFGRAIAEAVREACDGVERCGCVVLAQATMAVAAPHLADLGVPVYSSPRLAAEAVVKVARSGGSAKTTQ